MIKKTRDMATVFTDVYSCVAPKMLKEQHEFLLNSLENHFKNIPAGSLIVLGPGGLVLPYSMKYLGQNLGKTNRKRIKEILKNGRAVFVDYVLSEKHGGLEKQLNTLENMGFFEKNYFLKGAFNPEKISNTGPGLETLSFLLNNARDPLKIDDDFADAVDANLSLHHAYFNRAELDRLCKELYRVIKPGGLLHLGEGNVDMNYSEDKIIQLATDLSRMLKKSIVVTDDREKDSGYIVQSYFAQKKKYHNLPITTKLPKNHHANITITEDGLVVLKPSKPSDIFQNAINTPSKIAEKLRAKGYKQMIVSDDSVTLPLIDSEIEEDRKNMIEPIDTYYDSVQEVVRHNYEKTHPELYKSMSDAILFERGHAKRGVVEYFMGKEKIITALKKAGFKDVKSVHNKKGPLYNVLAYKK